MKIMTRYLVLFSLLGLISSGSIYLVFNQNFSSETQNPIKAYLNDVQYYQYNSAGRLTHFIKSSNVRNYRDKNISEFDNPKIKLYMDQTIPWEITAVHARSTENDDFLDLWGNVVIHRSKTSKQESITINTSKITMNFKKNNAETNQPVTITQPHGTTEGIGATLDFKTQTLKLLSNSKGSYDEQQSL